MSKRNGKMRIGYVGENVPHSRRRLERTGGDGTQFAVHRPGPKYPQTKKSETARLKYMQIAADRRAGRALLETREATGRIVFGPQPVDSNQ